MKKKVLIAGASGLVGGEILNLLDNKNLDITLLSRRCPLYTSDAADDLLSVDLGGRCIIKKKASRTPRQPHSSIYLTIILTHTL